MITSEFSNRAIELQNIPTLSPADKKPLVATYYKTNLMVRFSLTFVLLIILTLIKLLTVDKISVAFEIGVNWALGIAAAIGLYSIVFGYFSDRAISYTVREMDITRYSGVFFKKVITQPFLRLQHIELKRGPIERKVGLATIQVFSAGGAQHTFALPGLTLEQATALRQYILSHKDVNYHE